ncbi:hypothetical protein E2C01_021495 [Portunus trituberculatus]|uniref:Uncharacterized protein n=1 Tax=Portunus trituberculatus TaxID=210409 RepID=A0A5B7E687_PORTR|nr:hypothetical protein [Portunus trituberculatus]
MDASKRISKCRGVTRVASSGGSQLHFLRMPDLGQLPAHSHPRCSRHHLPCRPPPTASSFSSSSSLLLPSSQVVALTLIH